MMLVHRQKLRFEQMLKKLLTEKKNVEKQKRMSSATTSWDPEELIGERVRVRWSRPTASLGAFCGRHDQAGR